MISFNFSMLKEMPTELHQEKSDSEVSVVDTLDNEDNKYYSEIVLYNSNEV